MESIRQSSSPQEFTFYASGEWHTNESLPDDIAGHAGLTAVDGIPQKPEEGIRVHTKGGEKEIGLTAGESLRWADLWARPLRMRKTTLQAQEAAWGTSKRRGSQRAGKQGEESCPGLASVSELCRAGTCSRGVTSPQGGEFRQRMTGPLTTWPGYWQMSAGLWGWRTGTSSQATPGG